MPPFAAGFFCPHLKLLRHKLQRGELIIPPIQLPVEHTLVVPLFLLQRLNFQHPAIHHSWTLATGLDKTVRPLLILGDPLLYRRVKFLGHFGALLFIVNDVEAVHRYLGVLLIGTAQQREILHTFGKNGNWNVFPIVTLDAPVEGKTFSG